MRCGCVSNVHPLFSYVCGGEVYVDGDFDTGVAVCVDVGGHGGVEESGADSLGVVTIPIRCVLGSGARPS